MVAQSYFEKFVVPFQAGDMAKAEKALQEWDLNDSSNPELYVAYFNFFTVKSLEKDSTKFDRQYAKKALEFISEGIDRFPTRFDMRYAKISMLGQLEEYTPFTNEVVKMIEYSKTINNDWKEGGFALISDVDVVIDGAVNEAQQTLFAATEKDTSLYKNILRISDVMLKTFPKNISALNNIASVHLDKKQYDKAIENLQKAKDIEPSNARLQYKIGYIYGLKKDKANARKYYEMAVKNATDSDKAYKDAAQKQLDAMK
jgi:tetratricopeptide (TPR) repeat protein